MEERSLRVLEFQKIRQMLADGAASQMGKDLCLALEPLDTLPEVEKSQQETEEAVVLLTRLGASPISSFENIAVQLKKAQIGAVLSPRELLQCAAILRAARSARSQLGVHKEDSQTPRIEQMAQGLYANQALEEDIYMSILGEEEVADQASPALASVRRQIRVANDRVREKLNHYIHSATYQKYLQEPIITMRNGRYVLPVKQEHRQSMPGLIHDQSGSGATLFIEPMTIVEINNDIKQLHAQEQAEIEKVLAALSGRVAVDVEMLHSDIAILAKLDFWFAKARLARMQRAVQPKLNDKGRIRLLRARHPLIPADQVVASDIHIGQDFTTLVVTGPNTGGKTVTLKTVGLLTVMAQSGLQIPALLGSEMAVFDDVFADIGDEQSIEQSLSTFSGHMTSIVHILQNVTPNSLVLFDELGAGTDPTEGAALAMAILDRLRKLRCRTIATTHYSELKAYALSCEGVENASVEFNVETLRPTYRLSIGIPGKSNAFEISRRLGLPEEIIGEATDHLSQEAIRFEDVISTAEQHRQIAEKERELAEAARQETVVLREEAEKMRRDLENQRRKQINDAKDEARRVIRRAQDEAERIINSLKKAQSEQNAAKVIQESRKALQDNLDGLGADFSQPQTSGGKPLKTCKSGDVVEVLTVGATGTALGAPNAKGEVQVQVGIMKMMVPLAQLRATKNASATKVETKRTIKTAQRTASLELDVRGQLPEEALENVNKYLSDCVLAGLNEVHIIHGKGTGTLRSAVQQELRHHPHVQEFRLGRFGEGEAGVTVVTLKP